MAHEHPPTAANPEFYLQRLGGTMQSRCSRQESSGVMPQMKIECIASCQFQTNMPTHRTYWTVLAVISLSLASLAQPSAKRKIIIDQDAAGPAGTDQNSMLLLIQSPQAQVLGITVITGDA